MASTVHIISLLCCLFATSLAKPNQSGPEINLLGLDLSRLPINTVAFSGTNVTFTCSSSLGSNPRVQWTEFASQHGGSGNLISDGGFVLPGHPSAARFFVNTSMARQFDLTVLNVQLTDGGTYLCTDTLAPATEKQRHYAELTVLEQSQDCITTVPNSGIAVEDTYYTYECNINYGGNIAPDMRWTGPGPFGQAQSDNGVRIWSGLSFYASRTMTNQHWTNRNNFTDYFLPVPPDSATNIPDYDDYYDTPRIQVNWPPTGMYADPVRPLNEYLVGDVIECFADAFPTATFSWHNMRTNERFDGSLYTITSDLLGTDNPMRCEAYNTINGFRFNRELQLQVIVPIPPTTPTTLPPTTTTPPPAVAQCTNPAGRWESIHPTAAYMCLEVDAMGNIHGVLRNATEPFWLDVVGTTNMGGFDHVSFTAIWPLNRAVSSFIGECSRCYGGEILLMSVISRTKGGPPCGQPGEISYSEQYEFLRNPTVNCPPISPSTFKKD